MNELKEVEIGSYLGVPITLEDGMLFGTLCAVDRNPYPFNDSEIRTLKKLGNILSALISKQQSEILPKIDEKIIKLDKLALVGQLAAGLAHEIRNPMQSVKGFVQLLFNENKEMAQYKNIVIDELNRINELVSDFLLVTQPSSPKKVKGSIETIIQHTVEFLKSEAAIYNINLSIEICEVVPDFYFDPSQMKQVFINLIKNAIEAVGNNGHIRILINKQGNRISVNIKDSGPGIPLAILNKIEDPFFSTKETGTGLGLTISKTIVKEHEGTIKLENQSDGTLVSVELPLS